MDCEKEIIRFLKKAVKDLTGEDVEPRLEHPAEEGHGDYSSNVALMLFASDKQNAKRKTPAFAKASTGRQNAKWKTPLELAGVIKDKFLENKPSCVEKIEVAPPGFINFWLSQEALSKELELALKDGERYGRRPRRASGPEGRPDLGAGKKIMVEFAHPNTHKLFHIGHLRNITLGESISRLLEFVRVDVVRANYQGDIGLHIAKALWGLKTLGVKQPKTLDERIRLLARAYVKGNEGYGGDGGAKREIEEINRKLYEGDGGSRKDRELIDLWQETRKWSLKYFDRIYKRVGTKFDRLYFEGEVAEPGKHIVLKNVDRVFKKDEGAVIFPGEDYKLHNRVFVNSRGLPTYEAKDLGLAKLQFEEFSPDRIIHVVGPEQKGYFEVVFKAIETVFPELAGREYHLVYGWVRLKEGKMSSRKGDVVEGEWLLDETKQRLQAKYKMPEDVAEKVAVGAVKYSILRLHPNSEIAFDIDESIRLDGDSGPYLQYTFARTRSVLERASTDYGLPTTAVDSRQWTVDNLEPEELALLRHFYKFPEIVQEAAEKFSPNLLCNFLFELAQRYNTFYNKHRILTTDYRPPTTAEGKDAVARRLSTVDSQTKLRLALTQVTGNILKTGLGLLGIHAPERM